MEYKLDLKITDMRDYIIVENDGKMNAFTCDELSNLVCKREILEYYNEYLQTGKSDFIIPNKYGLVIAGDKNVATLALVDKETAQAKITLYSNEFGNTSKNISKFTKVKKYKKHRKYK